MIPVSERRRRAQGGFALLLVFALAAAIAINLYLELPRAAFEAQRAKEQLVMDRGKEYIRGIKLFVRKNRRFPTTMDELEKFQDRRFLRRRYKDPLTGSDEWRLINIDNAGMLTNSKVQTNQQQQGRQYNNTFISEGPSLGQQGASGTAQGVNLAARRRASDGQLIGPNDQAGGPVDPNTLAQGGAPPQQPQQPLPQPPFNQNPNVAAAPAGGVAGQPQTGPPQVSAGGQPLAPNQQQPQQAPAQRYDLLGNALPPPPGSAQPVNPQQTQPFNPQQPRPQPVNQQPGFNAQQQPFNPQQQPFNAQQAGQTYPTNPPGQPPGQQVRPGGPAPGQNAATNLIQQMLTTPRPMPGAAVQGVGQIMGGIAGVASKFEGESIMVYNERQRYEEWEFVYDMKKEAANNPTDRALQNAAGSAQEIDPLTGKPRQGPGQGGFGSGFNNSPGLGGTPGGGFGSGGGLGSGGFGNQPNVGQRPAGPRR